MLQGEESCVYFDLIFPKGTIISAAGSWGSFVLLEDFSRVVLMLKNTPISAGDMRDLGPIPGSGRSPGGGPGNPLQYPCLENPKDRGVWWETVHRVAKSHTQLK